MNFITTSIIICISTLTLYLLFLILGVRGIQKNRDAQGLDKISNEE